MAASVNSPTCCMHESFTSLEEVLHKVNRYSSAGAQMMVERGRERARWPARCCTAGGRSCGPICCRAGFLDGR